MTISFFTGFGAAYTIHRQAGAQACIVGLVQTAIAAAGAGSKIDPGN